MSNFTSVVIPYSGLDLINGAISGLNTLQFTSVKIGNGVYTGQENLANSKNLKSPKLTFSIESVKKKDNEHIIVRSLIKNDNVTESFNITEIGIFAKDSSNDENLIGITINTTGEPFPAYSLAPRTISLDLYIQIAGAGNIIFSVDGSPGIYVTTEEFIEHQHDERYYSKIEADEKYEEKTKLKEAAYREVSNVPTENSTKLITSGAVFIANNGKANASHKHTKADITDFPTSMPASDVPSWAKQASKPSYSASEVGALAVNGKATSAGTADSATNATNATNASNSDKVDNKHVEVLTQAAYDALGTKDANTIYFTT